MVSHCAKGNTFRFFAQRWGVLVVVVDVDVVIVDVVMVLVDVEVLVDEEVVDVVVSHPLHVLSHLMAIDGKEHTPAAKRRSH